MLGFRRLGRGLVVGSGRLWSSVICFTLRVKCVVTNARQGQYCEDFEGEGFTLRKFRITYESKTFFCLFVSSVFLSGGVGSGGIK